MRRAERPRRRPSDYARAFEAIVCLAIARGAIQLVPFRVLSRVFSWRTSQPLLAGVAHTEAIVDVRWAITAAARRLPGCTPCFARAIAAQAMLRRRGVDTTLFYGATVAEDRRLKAHVWLHAGDKAVVGHEAASDYSVLATYSTASS